MLDTRVIATKIDIETPYNTPLYNDEDLIEVLLEKFSGKCFQGIYIINIIAIKNRGVLIMSTKGGSIDVEFVAEGYYFPDNSLISNVKITLIGDFICGEILHKSNDTGEEISIATVVISEQEINSVLKVDNIVSVRVLASKYPPMKNKMNIFAELLVCEIEEQSFNVENNVTQKNLVLINELKEKISKELDHRLTATDKELKRILIFDRLLHSYSTEGLQPKQVELSKWKGYEVDMTDNIIDILSIDEKTFDFTGNWSKSLDLYLSSPLVKKNGDELVEDVSTISSGVFMIIVLETMLSYLKITREMTTVYDEKLFIIHNVIWLAMRNRQLKK